MSLSDYYWNQLSSQEKRLYEILEHEESKKNYGGGSTSYGAQLEIFHQIKNSR